MAVDRIKGDKMLDAYMKVLEDLVSNADLKGAVLSSTDGLTIASHIKIGDEDNMSAMSAAGYSLGMKVIEELSEGELEQITMKSENGLVVMNGIGDEAVLTCVADEKVNLGFLLVEMRKANKEFGKINE